MELINIAELKSHLSDVVAKVSETGDTIIIGKYGKPIAKLVPYTEELKTRKIGFANHLALSNIKELQKQVDTDTDMDTLEGFYQ